ncbi:hypothetical protein LMK08_20370 [Metapseudomonas furukawaii]|uniref:hypothetical protein n=1 Tax=Metapseudomonas furukawaii TaxID=1149133 RepID=UPI00227B5DA4|nr:hypothetical protein [Pseudomonas furukawaii]WAG77697.1 hypothetical protein LMK08_20370 [Pseudomonas furukawaii]
MFRFLKRKKSPELPVKAEQTGRDIISDPSKLADWVEHYFLKPRKWQDDLELLPDEDQQIAFSISFDEKERMAKEHSVLRIVGVLMFMRQVEDESYCEKLLSYLASKLASAIEEPRSQIGQALTDYLHPCVAGEDAKVASIYIQRIHDGNPNYLRLKLSGVANLGPKFIAEAFDIFRDSYYQLRTGYTFAEATKMMAAAEAHMKAEDD